jgi:hypothetical protein
MLLKTMQKIQNDKCTILVVAPYWQTQPWFPLYERLAISEIIFLGPNKSLLFDPYSNCFVSPSKKLILMVAILSGKSGPT